jgi:hypothetical protein
MKPSSMKIGKLLNGMKPDGIWTMVDLDTVSVKDSSQ